MQTRGRSWGGEIERHDHWTAGRASGGWRCGQRREATQNKQVKTVKRCRAESFVSTFPLLTLGSPGLCAYKRIPFGKRQRGLDSVMISVLRIAMQTQTTHPRAAQTKPGFHYQDPKTRTHDPPNKWEGKCSARVPPRVQGAIQKRTLALPATVNAIHLPRPAMTKPAKSAVCDR